MIALGAVLVVPSGSRWHSCAAGPDCNPEECLSHSPLLTEGYHVLWMRFWAPQQEAIRVVEDAVPGKLKILLDSQKTKDFDVKSPALEGLLACAPLTGDAAGMLHHQPARWLRQIDAGQLFPRAEWEVYACMALGLPAPLSARLAGGTKARRTTPPGITR
eukprot:2712212-Rhodomonas_salina.3